MEGGPPSSSSSSNGDNSSDRALKLNNKQGHKKEGSRVYVSVATDTILYIVYQVHDLLKKKK